MRNGIISAVRRGIKEKGLWIAVAVKNGIENVKEDVRAMGTIEVVLIVAILVALALLFKGFIGEYADKIFNNIENKTDGAFQDW